MHKYLIVIEKTPNGNFSAYSPDVDGCIAAGKTRAEARRLMEEALELHIGGLIEDGLPIPEPTSRAEYVSVAVA